MSAAPPLAERTDIHKGCKALEILLNLLNDYCEAAGAIVTLQKKLAKSLRENAGLKTNTEIAANAMGAAATIFDALSEIDGKFAKVADKEYDSISNEVKKWFKKLAKEEKVHDDKMLNANARLKQAGQAYEKKSKKGARDAGDEHARYINLINTLGPEVSQEKYNHALMVTQKHSTTTYSVAACVTRLADAEWVRSCESVRRIAPTVGHLGECRALCEGGWTGPVPYGLPDILEGAGQGQPGDDGESELTHTHTMNDETPSTPTQHQQRQQTIPARSLPEPPPLQSPLNGNSPLREQDPSMRPPVSAAQAVWQNRQNRAQQPPSSGPPSAYGGTMSTEGADTGSIRSLSVFPVPPTHYPIPPPIREQSASQSSSVSGTTSYQQHSSSGGNGSRDNVAMGGRGRISESPLPVDDLEDGNEPVEDVRAKRPGPGRRESYDGERERERERLSMPMPTPDTGVSFPSPRMPAREMERERRPSAEVPPPMPTTLNANAGTDRRTGEYEDNERREREPQQGRDRDERPELMRNDTGTTEHTAHGANAANANANGSKDVAGSPTASRVAQMRNRYSIDAGPSSPPPTKEKLNLPSRVSELANRYQSPTSSEILNGAGTSPTASPTRERAYPSSPNPNLGNNNNNRPREHQAPTPSPRASPNAERPRSQAYFHDDAGEEFAEKERQLRAREEEIEKRALELEVERQQLQRQAQHSPTSPHPRGGLKPRERTASLQQVAPGRQRNHSQLDLPTRPKSGYGVYEGMHASSTNNLVGAASSRNSYFDEEAEDEGRDAFDGRGGIGGGTKGNAGLRPPQQPSKPKGWMRRLSMPVVAQFTDSGKKHHSSSNSYGGGISSASLSLDSNARKSSRTDLRMGRADEYGARRSYDSGSGISHRSVGMGVGRR